MKFKSSKRPLFLASKASGSQAEKEVVELLRMAFSPAYCFEAIGGFGNPDFVISDEIIRVEGEVKSHPSWVDFGNLAIEVRNRKGKPLGPFKVNQDLGLYVNYIPSLRLAICSHPKDLCTVIVKLERDGLTREIVMKGGTVCWLVNAKLLVRELKATSTFYLLDSRRGTQFFEWPDH